ncbi:MAG: hypothetical protein JNK78_13095 [Planctomycetes bacterium]|nr:hypothetical protein [Planctomycetota bacterium]
MPAQPAKDDPGVVALSAMIEFVNDFGEKTDKELNGDRDVRQPGAIRPWQERFKSSLQ